MSYLKAKKKKKRREKYPFYFRKGAKTYINKHERLLGKAQTGCLCVIEQGRQFNFTFKNKRVKEQRVFND